MTTIAERVSLAPYSTLGVGGVARYFVDCKSEEEVSDALSYAAKHNLPVAVLGAGSNTLILDADFDGLVIKISIEGMSFEEREGSTRVVAGSGVSWDALVQSAGERGLWGVENLAAIPGSVGGGAVQNIGAYGAELSQTFIWAEVIALTGGVARRITKDEAAFAYRTSMFKTHRDLIITKVALSLKNTGLPQLSYPDLQKALVGGEPLSTPLEIAKVVRRIRAAKFPHLEGSAGSFFKNPIVEKSVGEALVERYPGLPLNETSGGKVKISLAWILDHILSLKGYAEGHVRLYEKQPLVLVAGKGASAREIEMLADSVSVRVKEATGLSIEREVETMRAR